MKIGKCASPLVFCWRLLLGNCVRFDENKVLLHPDSAVPDGHEGDAKEEAEDATDLGDHGRGRVKELLSFDRSVPETTVIPHW